MKCLVVLLAGELKKHEFTRVEWEIKQLSESCGRFYKMLRNMNLILFYGLHETDDKNYETKVETFIEDQPQLDTDH